MELKYYIGYSSSADLRYQSSSGGIGSALIKYLLESGEFGTAMTFFFDKVKCQYCIKLIYDYSNYNNCGSIYQDTDTIGFIKNNISGIKDGIVVTCMPCQVKAIRSILLRNNIKCFIISLCCSGQTTVQGTWCYYRLLGIKKEDVDLIQYRGNGWPSGIQIRLKSGKVIKRDNYTYPWTLMHESMLFRPRRCLKCPFKTSQDADVSLADPWLKEYIEKDKIGSSVIICNSEGDVFINKMLDENLLDLVTIDESTYLKSQRGTIETKLENSRHKYPNYFLAKMGKEGSIYKKLFTSSALSLKIHLGILRTIRIICKH